MRLVCRAGLVLLVFLAPAWLVVADEKADIERIVSVGRTDNRVMEHLDFLCNRFGPRLTGSDNLQNASEWTKDTFASFGLDNARLEEWGQFAVGFNRGPWFGRMVTPTEKTLHFGTNAWSAGTKGVQRGRAVLMPQDDEQLEQVRGQLPGAWVVARRQAPNAQPDGEFRKKRDEALKQAGIAGTVQPAFGTGSDLIITFGNPPSSWDKLPTTPSVNVIKIGRAHV